METLENLSFACIGHRGACGHAPENTLISFRRAMDMGCPWLELDVYAVEDELIVIHDDTLERTTNGFGRVMEQSLNTYVVWMPEAASLYRCLAKFVSLRQDAVGSTLN